MAKLKQKEVEAQLRSSSGNVTVAANNLGVTRNYLHLYISKHGLQGIVDEARQSMVDIAESALKRAVINGEAWAVCFTLKTQGKQRGYVERVQQEISGRDGQEIKITSNVFQHEAAIAAIAGRPKGDPEE